jgi:glycosyltransferase involved in cell wall biosynthesis
MDEHRLSICYVVPGHHLLSSAGPTRNVLSLAEALSPCADVTVAFRTVTQPPVDGEYTVMAIENNLASLHIGQDDAAIRGIGLREFLAYLAALRRFVDTYLGSYDIVLEKSWLLSGYVATLCQRRGVPAAVIENVVRVWREPLRTPHDLMRYSWFRCTQALVGRYLHRTPLIIAETEALKAAMIQRWSLPDERIKVVGLGVDHGLFRPLNQAEARLELGITPDATVLLYVGVLDQTHDLTPVLNAFRQISHASLELHIVGDGVLRKTYEELSGAECRNIVFHGRVPHTTVPRYIAAADLCLAPYDLTMFPNGQVAYSTLKIPEYMACARPVISVPSGHILTLVQDHVSGFLFHNHVQNWVKFLIECPAREKLMKMGMSAAKTTNSCNWKTTAQQYLDLCNRMVQKKECKNISTLL